MRQLIECTFGRNDFNVDFRRKLFEHCRKDQTKLGKLKKKRKLTDIIFAFNRVKFIVSFKEIQMWSDTEILYTIQKFLVCCFLLKYGKDKNI